MRAAAGQSVTPRGWFAALAGVLIAAEPLRARAGDLPHVETRAEALARDAIAYAARYGVPADQAVRDLTAQAESVATTDAIAREFAGRLVGIAIDRVPDFHIAVLLTGTEPVVERTYRIGGRDVAVVFRTGAAASASSIVSAITAWQAPIRAMLTRAPALGLDPRTGEMVVAVGAGDGERFGRAALATRLATMTGVPVRVEIAGEPADTALGGGARVTGSRPTDARRFLCTTGFAVTDGVRSAVATAAHCPDELTHVEADRTVTTLPFVAQAGWGYQDVQINSSPVPLAPWFFADTGRTIVRPVERAQGRASTRAGDFVCHRGERTGYSCAEVLMTDFAPAGDLCGGACLPTWVAVEGPDCRGGDSGGPVFSGTTALGLMKGGTYRADGTCAVYYYMSVDYLPTTWSLMLATAEPALSAGE